MLRWTYDVQIVGEVSDEVLATVRSEFGSVTVTVEPPRTLIRSASPDQAGMIGMLVRLQDLGLNIYGVRREDQPEADAGPGGSGD